MRVENLCATGTEALRGAVYAVAAGACDIAMAVGVEKLKDTGYSGLPERIAIAVCEAGIAADHCALPLLAPDDRVRRSSAGRAALAGAAIVHRGRYALAVTALLIDGTKR